MTPPGRDPRVTLFVNIYEFPMAVVSDYTDLISLYPKGDFLLCAVVDAVIWGMCFVVMWHVTRVIFRRVT
jgi:hypothetical protein